MAKTKKANLRLVKDDDDTLAPGPNTRSKELASFWKEQVDFVEQETKSWFKRGNDVVKRFRDERTRADQSTLRRLNVLWANIKILKPALYGKKPIPVVERKFLQRDPVGRLSAIMLERSTRNQLDDSGLHEAINRAVIDYLLPGRGVVWVRYEPEIGTGDSLAVHTQSGVEDELEEINEEYGKGESEDTNKENKLEDTGEQVVAEQAPVDYIDWHDFLIFPAKARVWSEVQAVGKRVYISKKEAKERFGKKIGSELKGDTTPIGQSSNRQSYADTPIFRDINERNIIIYEIWNKTDRKIYWVSPGYDYLCDVKDDFLKLKKFFPVPEPLSATLTNNSLVPVSDYYEYQDQAVQIDELTQRLALLTKACKVAGTYDASNAPLKRLMTEGVENELLPVDSWAIHAEKGGVAGGISFLPIDEIQKVIETLQKVRQQLMQDLDLITGISDIIRGTTDSRETLGGIRLKNNNAGTRLSDRQNEVARFARDTVAIIAEIIAKHFSDKTIIDSSGILYDDDMTPESILEEFYANLPPDIEEMVQQAAQQMQQGAGQQGIGQMPQPLQLPAPQSMPQLGPQPTLQPTPQNAPQPGLGMPPMGAAPSPIGGAPQPQGGLPGLPPGPQQGNPLQQLAQPTNFNMGGQQSGINVIQLNKQTLQIDPTDLVVEKIHKALNLIRNDVPRGYRIEIETDSTIFGDAAQERQDAVEFITAVMQFLTQAATVAQDLPEMTPLLGRFLQFGVRKFRVGRDLESSIDLFVRQMDKKAKDAIKNPQPSPEQMKAQSEQQKAHLTIQSQQMQNQSQREKIQMEQAAQHQNDQRDLQKAHMEDQRQSQLNKMEMELKQREHALKIREMELKHQIAMAELGAKTQHMQQQAEIQTQQNQQKIQQTQMQTQQSQVEHQQTMEQSDKQHQQTLEQTELQGEQAKQQHTQKMSQMKLQSQEKDKTRKDQAKKAKSKSNA